METKNPSPPPDAKEILAEAERRVEQHRAARAEERSGELSPTEQRLLLTADRIIFWLGRHWLAIANLAAFLYVGLPVLAPVLMHLGIEGPARSIYALYVPLCHQLPFRSFFLFGPKLSYSMEELSRLVGPEALVPHGYIGDPTLGFKIAFCQRDTAIYGSILLFGLIYALIRHRLHVRPIPFWSYIAFGILPIGLDGGIQILSYILMQWAPSLHIPPLESTPLRRVVTGSLFGLMTAWLSYPILQEAISEILDTLEKRFGWKR